MGTLFIGLAVLTLLTAVSVNIVDYSIYTYKRNMISKAMDYAVSAAVQEIDQEKSREGTAAGFSEETGKKELQDVYIDNSSAVTTFKSIFYENCELEGLVIDEKLLICTTSVKGSQMQYIIRSEQLVLSQGTASEPSAIEVKMNEAINGLWPNREDKSSVFINGNPKTNMLENGTYLLAYISNIKISGVYSQRCINLSSLAGSKVER